MDRSSVALSRRSFLAASLIAAGATSSPAWLSLGCQRSSAPEDFTGKERFEALVKQASAEGWAELPIGEAIGKVGMALRGTPWVASTLDAREDREVCSINLLGLDCVTFFETSLAFARTLMKLRVAGGSTMDLDVAREELRRQVTFARYRGGALTNYASRLHYLTDWFFDNERKGVVKVVTRSLAGAERAQLHVGFMSAHPDKYRQLRDHPALLGEIAGIEREINARETFVVPKRRVAEAAAQLITGDIVGITTTTEGLDCVHSGLCYRDEAGKTRLLHASNLTKQVTLDVTLSEVLDSHTKHTGILVARPLVV